MPPERTLSLVKPHAVAERWTSPIIRRYQKAGLTLSSVQVLTLTREEAADFYAEHAGKRFFERLIDAMSSGPTVALVWIGDSAIRRVRDLNGHYDPAKAEPGTIRCDFKGPGGPRNTVHGSNSREAVKRESLLIFGE